MQAQLSRFSHRADEQQDTEGGQDIDRVAREHERLARDHRSGGKDAVEIERPEHVIDAEHAKREAEIAHTIDDECLDGCRIRRRPLIPKSDQQV